VGTAATSDPIPAPAGPPGHALSAAGSAPRVAAGVDILHRFVLENGGI
jgi:hypothetical protein